MTNKSFTRAKVRILNDKEKLIGVFEVENYTEMLQTLVFAKEHEIDVLFNDMVDKHNNWFMKLDDIFQPTSITDIFLEFNPGFMPTILVYVI